MGRPPAFVRSQIESRTILISFMHRHRHYIKNHDLDARTKLSGSISTISSIRWYFWPCSHISIWPFWSYYIFNVLPIRRFFTHVLLAFSQFGKWAFYKLLWNSIDLKLLWNLLLLVLWKLVRFIVFDLNHLNSAKRRAKWWWTADVMNLSKCICSTWIGDRWHWTLDAFNSP